MLLKTNVVEGREVGTFGALARTAPVFQLGFRFDLIVRFFKKTLIKRTLHPCLINKQKHCRSQ